jgi:hypothetical protein
MSDPPGFPHDTRLIVLHGPLERIDPHGVRHRTRAPEKTVILMVESAGIMPAGD